MADTKKFRQAIKAGDLEAVKTITAGRFNVKTRYQHDWTGLHFAAKHGQVEIATVLLGAGAEVNALSESWQTPLDQARNQGHDLAAKVLAKHGGKAGGELSLHAAVYAGDTSLVRKHLNSGADVNGLARGELPICIALERRRWPLVRYLLKAGADAKLAQDNGDTAIHCAARSGADQALVKALIRAGADVNARGYGGERPLSVAAEAGDAEIVELLIARGAKVNSAAAAAALGGGHHDLARMLIGQGARVSLAWIPMGRAAVNIPLQRRL